MRVHEAQKALEEAQDEFANAMNESNSRIDRAYRTLKRVPDDIILAVMTDDMNLENTQTCLVGSVVQEKVLQMANLEFNPTANLNRIDRGKYSGGSVNSAQSLFGGEYEEWNEIYYGVTNHPEDTGDSELDVHEVEIALARRLDLALSRS